jgi:hypothetical protein
MRMLRYLKDQLPADKLKEATRHYFVCILCVILFPETQNFIPERKLCSQYPIELAIVPGLTSPFDSFIIRNGTSSPELQEQESHRHHEGRSCWSG